MKKPMPFDFLLDYLPRNVVVKAAIGMYYIYVDGKIMLIFRKTVKSPEHNGIWICTRRQDHASLKADIPAIIDFGFDEGIDSEWLLLSENQDDFESAAIQLCERVNNKDPRIGKVTPKSILLSQHPSGG